MLIAEYMVQYKRRGNIPLFDKLIFDREPPKRDVMDSTISSVILAIMTSNSVITFLNLH